MIIKAAQYNPLHPEFALDCEVALEAAFCALVDDALQAGWPPLMVYAALASLAENQRLAYIEDPA